MHTSSWEETLLRNLLFTHTHIYIYIKHSVNEICTINYRDPKLKFVAAPLLASRTDSVLLSGRVASAAQSPSNVSAAARTARAFFFFASARGGASQAYKEELWLILKYGWNGFAAVEKWGSVLLCCRLPQQFYQHPRQRTTREVPPVPGKMVRPKEAASLHYCRPQTRAGLLFGRVDEKAHSSSVLAVPLDTSLASTLAMANLKLVL